MLKKIIGFAVVYLFWLWNSAAFANSPWGEKYFPNTDLITHEGKTVRFFEDLIKDKIVAINFIYTTCPDACPLETAQLAKVQKIMGDRLGKDIFFYSISIDPDIDTPKVLSAYRKRFGAKWTFLTGNKQDIVLLRRKLGLYIDGADDGPNKNNHNVSMIIGNQKTGRWMKRSPFENPYVLADQLGNWLTGWKSPQRGQDYSNAPQLRSLGPGESLFRTRCASCHSVDGVEEADAIGPDLAGVTKRRDINWLLRWLQAPDKMIANKDPLALALLKKYNNLPMPNLRLNKQEALDLIDYMDRLPAPGGVSKIQAAKKAQQKMQETQQASAGKDLVAVMNAWVREAHPEASVNAGYMTLINASGASQILTGASSPDFERVEFHTMEMDDGMMQMRELTDIHMSSGESITFTPGGQHLMLKVPKRSLVVGDKVDITLEFNNAQTQRITVNVVKDF